MQHAKMLALMALVSCVSIPTHPHEEVCTLFSKLSVLILCANAETPRGEPLIEKTLEQMHGSTCRTPMEDAKHIAYVKAMELELKRLKDEAVKRTR